MILRVKFRVTLTVMDVEGNFNGKASKWRWQGTIRVNLRVILRVKFRVTLTVMDIEGNFNGKASKRR